MIRIERLRGIFAERGKSQAFVANLLGISAKTFYTKMKKGVFDSDEIMQMIKYFNIQNPEDIFFAQNVTYDVTKSKN